MVQPNRRVLQTGVCCLAWLVAACCLSGWPAAALAADYYVDGSAQPGGNGTVDLPFRTIQQGLNAAQPGDTVLVRAGTYTLGAALTFPRSGTPDEPIGLKAFNDEVVIVERSPDAAIHLIQTSRSHITIEGLVFDGHYGTVNGLLRFDGGSFQTLRRCEIRRHGHHLVRIDSSDFLLEDCHIHHAIWPNDPSLDAHCLHSQTGFRHTFRRCNVHHATGDLWQGSRDGAWGDILFEDCDLHIELADDDCNGIPAGTPITENHLDTKTIAGGTNRNVTLRGCLIRGSRQGRLGIMSAALNLKDVVEGFHIHHNRIFDNAIAFRLRAPSTDYRIHDNFIYDNDVAFRLEDGIGGIQIVHNTLHDNTTLVTDAGAVPAGAVWTNNILAASSAARWRGTYAFTANLFWQVPVGWPAASNLSADPQFVNAASYNLHLTAASPAIEAAVVVADADADFDGDPRPIGPAPDIGADEFRFIGDVDADGEVSVLDVVAVVSAFGSTPGDSTWKPDADTDGDGQISVLDVVATVTNFGSTVVR